MTVLAAGVCLLVFGSLAPQPTSPAQPTSKPVESRGRDADDVAPMSDEELTALSEPLEDSVDVEPIVIDVPAKVAQAPSTVTESAPGPTRASDRSVRDAFPPSRSASKDAACDPVGLPATSALAPHLLEPRWEPGAALLGGFVGFGTGFFYAGAPRRGLVMGIADTLLLGGLAGSVWALNEHVVREDRRTGLSLSREERSRDGTESTLYALSWGLGIAAGLSRIYQAVDGYRAAVRTNAEIANTSVVPLATLSPTPGGGAVALAWTW